MDSSYEDDISYIGSYLVNLDTSYGYFFAPVLLPHGVTVTNVTFYCHDDDANLGMTYDLYRYDGSIADRMAGDQSLYSPGSITAVDTSISYATIDNSQYSYYLLVIIPGNAGYNLRFRFATIGFAYPT